MNRTIKFRGYNLKNKKWLYGYYLVNRGKHYIVQDEVVNPFAEESDFEVDPESVGQYVLTNDGTDIYEGDIIKTVIHSKYDSRIGAEGKVFWDNVRNKFVIYRNDRCIEDLNLYYEYSFKVVCNEYEEKLKISNP